MSGYIPIIRHGPCGNRERFTRFKEWIACEEDSRAAYVDWLLRDHSGNPDSGIEFSRCREGRGFWWRKSDKTWTSWEKPFLIMDRIQQRCVILTLENISIFDFFCYGMSRLHRSQWNIHLGPDTPEQECTVYFSRRGKPIDTSWDIPHDMLHHLPEVLPKFRSFLRLFAIPVRYSMLDCLMYVTLCIVRASCRRGGDGGRGRGATSSRSARSSSGRGG